MSTQNNSVPARLSETKAPSIVDVDFSDKVVLESEAIEALQRQGCVRLNKSCLHDLEIIGTYVRGAGVLRHQRGGAIVTQQFIRGVMSAVADMVENGKPDPKCATKTKRLGPGDLQKIAQAAASLANALTKSQDFMLDVERLAKPSKTDDASPETPRMPFLAGSDVKPPTTATQINATNVFMAAPVEKSGLSNPVESPKQAT